MEDPLEPAIAKIEGFVEGFFWILPNLGIALIILALFFPLGWAVRRTVVSVSNRRGRRDLGRLLGGFLRAVVIVLGVLVACTIVFPSVKPADLFAALGVGSVAIGFAFGDILQNWLSGMLILYRQPFRRGDEIRSGEFEGMVEAVEARARTRHPRAVLKTFRDARGGNRSTVTVAPAPRRTPPMPHTATLPA